MNRNTPRQLTLLFWLSIVALLGAAGGIGAVVWEQLITTVNAMIAVGWGQRLGNLTHAAEFVGPCLIDAQCTRVLQDAWMARLPEWLIYLPVVPLFGLAYVRVVTQRRGVSKDPGEARWATTKDLAVFLRDDPKRPPRVGYMGLHAGKHVVRLPEPLRCSHTFIVGGTGAGKTTRYLNTNLLLDAKDACSSVVFDLKYPDPRSGFLEVINFFRAWGRQVFPFTPFDPDSARLPLLHGVNSIQDALDMAEIFRPGSESGGDGAAFYKNNERQLLAGLIFAVSREPEPSLLKIYQVLGQGLDGIRLLAEAHPESKLVLGTLLGLKPDLVAGLCSGLAGDLQIFLNVNLNRATSAGPGVQFDIRQVCRTSGLMYVGIPQEEIQGGKGQVLLRLIKRMLDRAILEVAGENEGRLPVHLNIYFDEFPSFGPLPNINENLATMRSRRVAYHIAVQNRAQGEAIYGRDAFRAMINNNFGQMVIFPRSLRLEDARYFAENLGEMTAVQEQYGESREAGMFGSVNVSRRYAEVARLLLSSEAMRTFPDGSAVVELLGAPPAVVRLPRLDEPENPYAPLYARIRARYPVPQLRRPGAPTEGHQDTALALLASPLAAARPAEPAKNPLAEHFRTWVAQSLDSGVPITTEFDETARPTQVVFRRAELPELPTEVREWQEKGWVHTTEELVVVTRLGLSRVERLWKNIRHYHEMSGLLRWAADHAGRLAGHPRAGDGAMAESFVGRWDDGVVLVPPEIAVTLGRQGSVQLQHVTLGQQTLMLAPVPWRLTPASVPAQK